MKTIPFRMRLSPYYFKMRKALKESHKIMEAAQIPILGTKAELRKAGLDDIQNLAFAINGKLSDGAPIHSLRYAEDVLDKIRKGWQRDGREGVIEELGKMRTAFHKAKEFWN